MRIAWAYSCVGTTVREVLSAPTMLEYAIFLPPVAPAAAVAAAAAANSAVSRLSAGYLWHCGAAPSLALSPPPPPPLAAATLLRGSFAFGENVEDEWFAVWLLSQAAPAAAAGAGAAAAAAAVLQLRDDDGDFLLIEAAGSLPRWVHPERVMHRVFLSCAALGAPPTVALVPPSHLVSVPSAAAGAAWVRDHAAEAAAAGASVTSALASRLFKGILIFSSVSSISICGFAE